MADRGYWQPTPAAAVPEVAPGTVLIFTPDELRYTDRKIRLRLDRVRDDLGGFYEDHVWLQGWTLSADGSPSGWIQILARVDAIPQALERGTHGPATHP